MIHTLANWDHDLFFLINRGFSNTFFDLVMPWLREAWIWLPVYGLLLVAFVRKYKWRSVVWICGLIVAVSMSDLLASSVFKPTFKRPRPCHHSGLEQQVILRKRDGNCGGPYGFASSHASNHFAIALFCISALGYKRRLVPGLLLFGWATAVSFAQVYVGVHFPADILMGAILGMLSAGIILRLLRRISNYRST